MLHTYVLLFVFACVCVRECTCVSGFNMSCFNWKGRSKVLKYECTTHIRGVQRCGGGYPMLEPLMDTVDSNQICTTCVLMLLYVCPRAAILCATHRCGYVWASGGYSGQQPDMHHLAMHMGGRPAYCHEAGVCVRERQRRRQRQRQRQRDRKWGGSVGGGEARASGNVKTLGFLVFFCV